MKLRSYISTNSVLLVIIFIIIAFSLNSCNKEHSESFSKSNNKEEKLDNFLKSRKNDQNIRTGTNYSVDESVFVLEGALNFDYSFGTNRSSHLISFEDTLYIQTNNLPVPLVSEEELNQVHAQITSILADYYEELAGNDDSLVVITVSRIGNLNSQGQFQIFVTSLFKTVVPSYLDDIQSVDCLTFLSPFPTGDDLEFGLKLGYCDNRNVPPTDGGIELAKEINQTFDPNPRVYYTDIKKTCAGALGFVNRCDRDVVFWHDVDRGGIKTNLLDYLVFARSSDLPNYDFCIPYNHLNCYFSWMFNNIAPQYNEEGRVFFCLTIISSLIPGTIGSIGHGNTLYYGNKKIRLVSDPDPYIPVE